MTSRIAQALLGRPNPFMEMAQAQSPSQRLHDRGYLDKAPPAVVQQDTMGPAQTQAFENYMRPRIDVLRALGMSPPEARSLIEEMPDVVAERRRLGQEGVTDPQAQENLRRLLEDLR